jgi:hypothetical protein
MLIYFIIATLLAVGLIIYTIADDGQEPPIILLIWAFLVLLPSFLHTTDVKVETTSRAKVYMLSPYKAILSDPDGDEDSYKTITDAYTLSQIPKGNYVIQKHTCYNMWGSVVQDELFLQVKPKK